MPVITLHGTARRAGGFSLFEVMVALLVVAIGLLGVAKMQAAALAATSNSQKRALAAFETDGLVSMMHANRSYWAAGAAPAVFTITNGVISDPTLAIVAGCLLNGPNAPCTPTQMAAFDMQQWGAEVTAVLPSPVTTTITCTPLSPNAPVSCTVTTVWGEQTMNMNAQGIGGAAAQSAAQATNFGPTYTLTVEP